MLQQTQVEQVIPYYHRFLKRFPTLKVLARAPLSEVLDLWAGLGYYSRARNLHACVRQVMARHGGVLPEDPKELLQLSGIGRYTAGAVASIAFSKPVPLVDGNVTRVLCRAFGIRKDPRDPAVQKRLWDLAAGLVPKRNPGDFNQALMDLGALVCVPKAPQCGPCPLRSGCLAYRKGWQEAIPPPKKSVPRRKIRYVCGILTRNGSVLVARRPFAGLLAGLWEFPGGESRPDEPERESLTRSLKERLGLAVKPSGPPAVIRQILTHRELEIHGFACAWSGSLRPQWYPEVRWVAKGRLAQTPFTAGMGKLAKQLNPGS
jgi:A/G-specific adenine glycosylase